MIRIGQFQISEGKHGDLWILRDCGEAMQVLPGPTMDALVAALLGFFLENM